MPIKKSQKARREPSQERSRKSNEYILEAAAQVLEKDGPFKFTTLKIAQKAGISIGSLYQYYANKEAILFTLHKKEWLETISKLESTIKVKNMPGSKKIEILILNFFESEFQERKMRNALIATGLLLKNTTEYISLENQAIKLVRKLLKEIYPNLKNKELNFKAEYLFVKITSIAENASSRVNSLNEMKQWAQYLIKEFSYN